jgi:hypothetical protein
MQPQESWVSVSQDAIAIFDELVETLGVSEWRVVHSEKRHVPALGVKCTEVGERQSVYLTAFLYPPEGKEVEQFDEFDQLFATRVIRTEDGLYPFGFSVFVGHDATDRHKALSRVVFSTETQNRLASSLQRILLDVRKWYKTEAF